jgi:hypothetical protein
MMDSRSGSRVWWWIGAATLGAIVAGGACVIDGGPGPTVTELYALIDAHCESATTCDCAWVVVEEGACTGELEARWKARLSEAQRRELRYDAECFASLSAQIDQWSCYWPEGEIALCQSYCAPFHGERAEGDDCEGDDALVSDCAQGLVCHDGTCTSPCAALGGRHEGEPCGNELQGTYDDCAGGLYCGASGVCEGTAAAGSPCQDGSCGTGLYCDWQNNVCVAPGGVGAPCIDVPCSEELFCNYQSDVCQAPVGEGESCYDFPCADALFCEWSEDGWNAYCRSYASEGEDCLQRPCVDMLWCDETNRCVTAPAEGQPCLFGSVCDDGLVCNSGIVCVTPPEEGQPCIQGTCADDSWCDTAMDPTGICAPQRAIDEMCAGHRQCQSGYCPNGFCWALPFEGDRCEDAGVCAAGLVCNGTTCEPTLTRAPAACSYPGW